jgi:DNA-binding IclR family transcriptional regulator
MENQNHMGKGLKNGGNKDNTKSIDKTLAILCTFNEAAPRQRTTDIAAKLNMSVSTVSRHLGTLLDWGFLERDDATGYYQPGDKIISLAGVSLQNNRVYRHALPELHELTRTFNVHGHMSVPRGTSIIHLISLGGENAQEWLLPLGYAQPMYCSAMGRAMLAYMPAAKAQEILRKSDLVKRTEETKINMDEIMNEMKKGRKKGYFMIVNELNHGRASIGVPIFDQNANPIAAISLSASESRLSKPEDEAKISSALKTAGTRISAMLGYYPR